MPNWCENTLIVAGEKWNVEDFIQQVKSSEDALDSAQKHTLLENLYPTPDELNETTSNFGAGIDDPQYEQKQANIEKYGAADWYEWRNEHWGTKWGDCHTVLVDEDYHENFGKVMFQFDTAWSPPAEGLMHIAKMFPRLLMDLRYAEPGMCFQGYLVVCGNNVISDVYMEYMENSQSRWEWIGEEYGNMLIEWEEKLGKGSGDNDE
jgi:hypothetical protein|tara:strand:- start:3189 stop:3806 length:618 start_codon:yes stop_codon:yes gene_type:complete